MARCLRPWRADDEKSTFCIDAAIANGGMRCLIFPRSKTIPSSAGL